RVVRDFGQYEIFANDGQISHSASFAFTPTDASLSITANGALSVVSADFHPLNRAWPGKAASSSTIIDDKSAATAYTGTWTQSNEGRYFGGSCHVSPTTTGAVEATFQGTRIEWYALKNVDLGKADVYIDGVLSKGAIDAYSAKRQNALLFTQGSLA